MNSAYPEDFSPKTHNRKQHGHKTSNKNGAVGAPLIQSETAAGNATDKLEPYPPISKQARTIYQILQLLQVLFTITVVTLFALQYTAALTVRDLVYVVITLQVLTLATKGMNSKIEKHNSLDKLLKSGDDDFVMARARRNESRSVLLLISAILASVAAVDVVYIAMIANDMEDRADPFHVSGKNKYLDRSLDVLASLLFGLGLPAVLLLITQVTWLVQVQRWYKRRDAAVDPDSKTEITMGR